MAAENDPEIAFEDLPTGTAFDLGTIVIDGEEMVEFARRFDPQPFHLDEAAGKESIFGQRLASGWFTAGLWMRAYVDGVLSRAASLGSPGGEEVSWLAPVFAGDELQAGMEVLDARRSKSRSEIGLVKIRGTMRRGPDTVLRLVFTGLFGLREPAG